jgi:hypothetical protein
MLLHHLYATGLIAALLTGAWLFKPRERTILTTLGAFLAWLLVALFGGSAETFADAGETVRTVNNTTLAVSDGAELTAAPIPEEFRWFAALWALLSVVALLLYTAGVYPPESGDTYGTEETQNEPRR